MTNAGTPMGGTPGKGGMPKWLIILLVVLLVIILGCCGGIGTCFYLAHRAAPVVSSAAQRWTDDLKKEATEAARQGPAGAAAGDNAAPTPAGDNATPAPDGAAPATPDAPAAPAATPAVHAQKLPASFPTDDVPIESGLTPTFSMGDNTKGNGSVVLSGKVKADDVVAYYTKQLADKGWTQTNNTAINTMTQMQYKKDAMTLIVQVTGGEGNDPTTVMLSYEKQP